jgi:hypothetical protein
MLPSFSCHHQLIIPTTYAASTVQVSLKHHSPLCPSGPCPDHTACVGACTADSLQLPLHVQPWSPRGQLSKTAHILNHQTEHEIGSLTQQVVAAGAASCAAMELPWVSLSELLVTVLASSHTS